jgi:hypothetical protein
VSESRTAWGVEQLFECVTGGSHAIVCVKCCGETCRGPGDVLCERRSECEAFEFLDDFETYRAAHANTVSANVIMDPEGEL